MRQLKSILIAILAAVVLIGLVGIWLNKHYIVTREISIRSNPEKIFSYVKNLKTWPQWTVWNTENDPGLKISFEENQGVIKGMIWQSEDSENGTLKMINLVENKELNFVVQLEESFESKGRIEITSRDSLNTKVKWTMEGDVGNNIPQRFFILFADKFIGPDMEEGLKGLKRISEKE